MRPEETAGTVIGRYHLLQKIGEGGMGEVWLADQKEPVRRRVALKLVKAGMNSREVIARFESERQALALMDHPAIARVFDAGSTPQGAPYFVMEYVAGVQITTYCDNHRLNTRERLELFMHVCEGVQHAHQKAIIHRDLKPTNILVVEVDGSAAPKIIDFGVAKALTQRLTADTMFTRVGALVGTPEYMSPEQANSSGEDIDTRTDVYALGVVFYELLAGAAPLELREIAFDEFLRRLREVEPPKPSTKIRAQDHATSTELARKRHTEPLALAKQIRGDLDSIALKALEKDRSRRYGSPSDFAADIGRYLRNEAVLAVPASATYRARKFARRYRGALVTVCAFALVLTVAAAVSIRQKMRANREAAEAQAINNFLEDDLLAQADVANQSVTGTEPNPDLKVRTALDRAADRITGKFDKQPQVEASIRDTIGRTYTGLGVYPEARKQLERALDLRRGALGVEHPRTLATMMNIGTVDLKQGKYPQAEALFNQTLKVQRRVLGLEHPDTVKSMSGLANAYRKQGKYAQSETMSSQSLEIQRRLLGPEHPDTLISLHNLAGAYFMEGKYAQAEAIFSQILEIRRRVLGPEHPATLSTTSDLSATYYAEGKYAQAEPLFSQTFEIQRRVLGPGHQATLLSMTNLASIYSQQGKEAQSEALTSQGLEIQRRVLGAEHPDTLISMNNLADSYRLEGKYAQAEALLNQTLEIQRRVLGPQHHDVADSTQNLARVYYSESKYAQAEVLFSQSLEIQRRVMGREHPDTLETAANLALAYEVQGKFAASEALAREIVEIDRKESPDDWQRFSAESLLGASLAGQGKYAESETFLLEGARGMDAREGRIGIPDHYHVELGRKWIVQMYLAWGKPEKAAGWKKN
jgi:tetratricopeptide (TPR) repeat protein